MVRLDEIVIRVCRPRIFIQILHVRVRRGRIQVEVVLLHVLPVISLAVGQTEQPFLEDRILAVPQRNREAEQLLLIGDPGESVFAPAISSRARLIVAELIPGVARRAVIFADGSPLAFR